MLETYPKIQTIMYGNLIWDWRLAKIRINNIEIVFTEIEYCVLTCLLKCAGEVVSHAHIMDYANRRNFSMSLLTVKAAVDEIRMKLKSHESTCIIDTMRGRGYIVMQRGFCL